MGSTPRPLYERLVRPLHRDAIPWEQVDLFWGDERYVPHDDPSSNVQTVREALLADAPLSPGNVHPMPTERDDPDDAAADYADMLHAAFPGETTFDLVLLGLGSDGHTASLVQMPGRSGLDVVEAVGSYAEHHTGEETHLIRERMKTLEERLHPEAFMRIHRSTIVRLEEVGAMASGRPSGAVRSG